MDIPLDAQFLFYLVLIEMQLHISANDDLDFSCADPLKVKDGILHIHSTLGFNSRRNSVMTPDYCLLLGESLSHPVHAGKYVLDGQKYAVAARFLLDHFIQPSSKEYFLRQVVLFLFPAITQY
jgi:hypothetical protein